ncbi:MAG: helix-turn-helix domain-containing protein [Actinomycetota bacterium]|nr:helix-turn-helix domain-containing protein [Actinomycetota bacterium]
MRLNGKHTATGPTKQATGRATVGEAAEILGITAEAVRSRVKRGTLKSVKEGSTVYVLLEDGVTNWQQTADRTAPEYDRAKTQTPPEHDRTDDRAALVDSLEDQIRYLREQLAEEREARRRADTLLARLTEANASMAHQIRELTAPERPPDEAGTDAEDAEEVEERGEHAEAQADAQGGAEASEGAEHRPDRAGPQRGVQDARRPWWIRIFVGG